MAWQQTSASAFCAGIETRGARRGPEMDDRGPHAAKDPAVAGCHVSALEQMRAESFAGARRQAHDDVALEEDSDEQERSDRRSGKRGDRPPVDALRSRLARHHDGQGLRVETGEERSKEILVPAEDEGKYEGGDHSGKRNRQNDAKECSPDRAAVDERCLLQLGRDSVELVAHHPDDDREDHQTVEKNKAGSRVEQRQLLVENKERQREHHGRQDELGDKEEGNVLVPPGSEFIIEAAEAVSCERTDHDRYRRRANRADDAVDELLEEFLAYVRCLEDSVGRKSERLPTLPAWREIDPGDEMALRNVSSKFYRGREGPVDRK